VSGAAGCLAVLLAAAARYQRPRLLEIALRLGDFLVEQARPMDGGVAWGGDAARPPLCGFSHGAGGVSLALADLQAVTGEARFLGVAREGLAYERSQFDPAAGNWIDLRAPAGSPAATTAIAWCHGAPGIALSRLGLLQALGDDEAIRAELDVALATTVQNLRAESSATGPPGSERPLPLGNISLCHGAFGNADVLLLAARRLGQPALEQLARDIGRLAVRQVEARGLSWPSGNPGMHPTPGLMLGDAGAGTFYLRLHDPDGIPSPLWVRP
ncbi:MAG: lanthionine synthetase LanC family protein, partial [Acidobacteriota bacterium]